jgi:hypothetical protein
MAIKNSTIKKRLIQKRGHFCEKCKNTEWFNVMIPIELHHIDGNNQNNQEENLQLLCPNCHATTPNYRGKNMKYRKRVAIPDEIIIQTVPKCQSISEVLAVVGLVKAGANYQRVKNLILTNNLQLTKRELTERELETKLASRKVVRPSSNQLRKMLWEKPTSTVAKELGVSFNAIVKWCKYYGIQRPSQGYWQKLAAGKMVAHAVVATAL